MRYLLLILFGAVGYALFRTLTRPQADGPTLRRESENLGLEVNEVTRSMPVAAIGGRSYRLQDGRCARYRLPRHIPGAPRFELLQRPGTSSSGFAPGWQLVVHSGEVGPALRSALERVSREWRGDYLEFEGDEQGIAAFWNESRGQADLWAVHDFLKQISTATG